MTDLAAVPQIPRKRRKSALSPSRFEDLAIHIQTAAGGLIARYGVLYQAAHEKQVGAQKQGGGGDGMGMGDNDIAAVIVANGRLQAEMESASESLEFAWNSIRGAGNAFERAETLLDEAHPLSAEAIDRQRERPVMRSDLVTAYQSRAKAVRREAETEAQKLEKKASVLQQQIDADERRAAAVRFGRVVPMSKAQRRRSERGWKGAVEKGA